MFHVYAVKLRGKEKERFYIGTYEDLFEAKHACNACTCGNADYAYVKDSRLTATVFFLRPPGYEEYPIPPGPRRLKPWLLGK